VTRESTRSIGVGLVDMKVAVSPVPTSNREKLWKRFEPLCSPRPSWIR
jgi:hypothetical protein